MAQAARGAGPWYYGWNVVAAVILSQIAANALTFSSFSLFLRHWSADLATPVPTLVLALLLWGSIGALVSPMVGALADRYPARWLFGIGLGGMGLFFVALSFVHAGWQVLALYGGLSAPMLTLCTAVPGNAVISRWFVRRLGLALGLSSFGIGIGGIVVPPLVAMLLPDLGWRLIWRGAGALQLLVVMPLVVSVLRDRPGPRDGDWYLADDDADDRDGGHAHGHHGSMAGGPGWRVVFRRRRFWMLVATYLIILGTGGAVLQNIGPYAAAHGYAEKTAAALISVGGAMHVAGSLVLGMASDRFGPRACFLGLGLAVGGGLAALAFGGGSLMLVALGIGLIGMNAAVLTPLSAAIAREFGAEGFGQAFGLAMMFLPLCSPLAYVLAKTRDITGSYTPALTAYVAMIAVALALALALGRAPLPQPQPAE